MNEDIVIEIWDLFKDHVPERGREVLATQYVDYLLSSDIPADSLEGFLGYDPHLDTAIQAVIDELAEEQTYLDEGEEFEEDWD